MKSNKEEQDDSGYPLHEIEPVARIGVSEIVWPGFDRDHKTVDGVIDERYKDAADFDKENIGDRLQILDGVIKTRRSAYGFRIRIEVF
jgi:hypothetical protein